MDHARLEGIYEMALELGREQVRHIVGNNHGSTSERMKATALLIALDEHQLIAADVAAFARFVSRVRPPADHDWSEEPPIAPRLEQAYRILESYFRDQGRTPPWVGLESEASMPG
jgi:hypothetical protein